MSGILMNNQYWAKFSVKSFRLANFFVVAINQEPKILSFYELEYRFNVYSDYELAETFARDIRGRHNSILHTK